MWTVLTSIAAVLSIIGLYKMLSCASRQETDDDVRDELNIW